MVTVTDVGRRVAGETAAPLKRIREDALPEHLDYPDLGCELSRRCLTCPLPRCKHDEPGGAHRLRMRARDRAIVAAHEREKLPSAVLAKRFGLSRRSVFRILAKNRTEPQRRRE